MQSERRRHPVTGAWIIVAPGRGHRPNGNASPPSSDALPSHDPDCPFCPGNEDRLPGITLERQRANGRPWQTRVIPNKYPALTPETSPAGPASELYRRDTGAGFHDVIIESAVHNQDVADMDAEEAEVVVGTYLQRFCDLQAAHPDLLPFIFRNHGARAGASLAHPHAQLMATSWVPAPIRDRWNRARQHYDRTGHCIYCDILAREEHSGTRVVSSNDSFCAFVPFFAEVPYETWIVPYRHAASFGDLTDGEAADLAVLLPDLLARLNRHLDDPDYNYVVQTTSRARREASYLHWYLRIVPKLKWKGGFEIGAETHINPSRPEQDAKELRSAAVSVP